VGRTFTLTVTGDLPAAIRRVEGAARRRGWSFSGDEQSGRFSGPRGLEGRYECSAGTLTVVVTRKPFLLPWRRVEARLRAVFGLGE
jgi:hypothetical protein